MRQTASFLHAAWRGPSDGEIWMCFGGFLDDLDDIAAFAQIHIPDARALCVRGARAQTQGGNGVLAGHFWYIGTVDQPELSTFGDGLYQAETLFLERARVAGGKISLIGREQGGAIALTLAALWPEHVAEVVSIGAGLPLNLARMPLTLGSMRDVGVTLKHLPPSQEGHTRATLATLGVEVL